MIEASRESLACVDRQIELELVAGARRRVRPDGAAAVIEIELGVRYRYDARGAAEELRKSASVIGCWLSKLRVE